jgi:PAP2 superfamily
VKRRTLLPSFTKPGRGCGLARFTAVELVVWATVYAGYLAVRSLTIGSTGEAFAHAWHVVDVERAVGVGYERALQDALAPAADAFSTYYMLGFGPLIGAVLVWLGLCRPELYRSLRTALLLSIAIATVVFVLFPTAPPRLVTGLGIEDTVGLAGHDMGSFLGIRFNPYAAVPSMHVGWSLVVGIYAFRAARRRLLRIFFAAHPALMAVAVTATGNHFFLDSLAGVAVACLTLAVLRRRPAARSRTVAGAARTA